MAKYRSHLTYANAMATVAVFIALGGTSYAALTITGKNVKNSTLTGKDVKNNSLTGKDVKGLRSGDVADSSLLAKDFKAGQLPEGAQGPKGDKGDPGVAGAPATKLWARVLGNGTLNGGSGVTGVTRTAAGRYTVAFNQDVSSCAWIAMPVFRPGTGWGAIAQGNADGTASHVVVFTSLDTSATVDEPFDLAVFC